MDIKRLDIFHPKAKRAFFEKKSDGFSFADFLDLSILSLAGVRRNRLFTPEDLKDYIGYDISSPTGEKTFCAHCLASLIMNEAEEKYPDDKKLQTLIGLYDEIDEMLKYMSRKKIPSEEILRAQKRLEITLNSWPVEELRRIQNIFINIKNNILARNKFGGSEMLARYRVKIQAREEDEDRGVIVKKEGKPQYVGSYVIVGVNKHTCFRKIIFVLGLEPGYHVIPACGNPGYHGSHLYHLRNFRFKLPDQNAETRHWWNLLPSKTYSEALDKKIEFEESQNIEKNKSTVSLWEETRSNKEIVPEKMWLEGEVLKEKLSIIPDKNCSHTVRAIALRKNTYSKEWEILLQTEIGDRKKPPGIGCPGGTVDYKESIGRSLERETENESMCGRVTKIIAQVAETKKTRLPGFTKDNIDHWFLVETMNQICLPGTLKEPQEIKADSQKWVPLSELPNFTFQNKRRPIRNVQIVERNKMMYLGHAINISRVLPRISWIELPPNWNEFIKNIEKFKERL